MTEKTPLKSMTWTLDTILSLESQYKKSRGDNRGRLKAQIMLLKNNVWLCKKWVKPELELSSDIKKAPKEGLSVHNV